MVELLDLPEWAAPAECCVDLPGGESLPGAALLQEHVFVSESD
jgi:hypothetical protein